jgi:mercuric ion transport protein
MIRPPSSRVALLGAAFGAVAASVCCVVPLVLVLMGISGAWISNLTAFDAWRPWTVGATLIFVGWSFWTLYGPTARCDADGACASPAVLARRRRWLWLAVVVIAALLLFPYYIGWFL